MDSVTETDTTEDRLPTLHILVVDDDPLTQRMLQLLLQRDGHQVELASNGLEAFDTVKFKRFDIVFMDLMMPVMDGMEASLRIRDWEKDGPRTFIVALTASYLTEDGHRLYEAGIDNYIAKPFEVEHVQRMLKYSAAMRSMTPSNQKITFPQRLSFKEILEINDGKGDLPGDQPLLHI